MGQGGAPRTGKRLAAVVLVAATQWQPALAADEDLFFSSLPVVATVSRLPQPQSEAPGAVTVIDRDMIRASGARSVSDLLRLVPGFQVVPTSTDWPIVTYHGLNDENFSPRVQVLVDGRSLYSPLNLSGVNWNLMPVALEDIERIEVLRGTNTAAYGSNAFLGVVNIITIDPSQTRGGSVSVNHGNQGVRDASARLGFALGPGNVRLTAKQQDDDGITNQNDWTNNFRSRLFDLRADFAVSDKDELQIGAGHVGSEIENGRVGDPCNPLRGFQHSSNYVQLGWHRALANNGEVSIRYSHTDDWASDQHIENCNGFLLNIDYGGRAARDDIEVQHTFSPAAGLRLVWGVGARHDSVRGPLWFYGNTYHGRQVSRLFGNLEARPAQAWLVNVGGMWERDSVSGTTFSPRLSVSYHINAEHTVRFGATRAYRTPSIHNEVGDTRVEAYYAMSGNALGLPPGPVPKGSIYLKDYLADRAVEPEKLNSLEVGYLAELREWRMSLDLRLFSEHIFNRILTASKNDPCALYAYGFCFPDRVKYAANAQDTKVYGIEYQWRWQPFDTTRLLVNQAFIHIDQTLGELSPPFNTSTVARIGRHTKLSVPHRASTLMLMQRLPYGLELAGTYHFVDKTQWTRNTETPVAPYRRLDLRLGYPFKLGVTRGEVAYTIQNANGEHAEFKYDRIFSERHWLTLRLDI